MPSRDELISWLRALPSGEPDAAPDPANSISGKVIRCCFEGQRAVAVGSDADGHTQITALLDLLDLHLNGDGRYHGQPVRPDEVTLILGGCPGGREAVDALGSLIAALSAGPGVRLLLAEDDGGFRQLPAAGYDFGDESLYPRWLGLMMNVAGPPALLTDVVHRVGNDALRAYQMLSGTGGWSLRLEGLEVGRFRGERGWLNVGKDGQAGAQSPARKAWQQATGTHERIEVTDAEESKHQAASALAAFAAAWLPRLAPEDGAPVRQNEHALESRILRGLVPVTTPRGRTLDPIRRDPIVNWGSQFPTRWGKSTRRAARYLDALLRDGTTPWAVEIKIHGSAGVGQYYRHAIAQAALYRQFIRTATPLRPWFERYDLDQALCHAAVLVPDLDGPQAKWASRMSTVADALDVAFIQIPGHFAELH